MVLPYSPVVALALMSVVTALVGITPNAQAADVTWDRLLNADKDPNNWLMYHGSLKGWHYSGLDQITKGNVKNLRIAWMHTPAAPSQGVQSFPIVVDGRVYYTSSVGRVWALDAATGALLWSHRSSSDYDRATDASRERYSRGIAVGYDKVYCATADGRVVALDQASGEVSWETPVLLEDADKEWFGSAPLVVKDKLLIGAHRAPSIGCCGPIFALSVHSGAVQWEFREERDTRQPYVPWSEDASSAGESSSMIGSYDATTNSVWWGMAAPATGTTEYGRRSSGEHAEVPRYSSSVLVLDADSGALKAYFSEIPNDIWGLGSASSDFLHLERGGRRYLLHLSRGGIAFLYNSDTSQAGAARTLRPENAYIMGKTFNYVQGVSARTGELIGRREPAFGARDTVCPAMDGAVSWSSGAYNPSTGLYYRVLQEWCAEIGAEQNAGTGGEIGVNWSVRAPAGRQAFGTLQAREPISGAVKWEIEMKYPPLGSLLTTKGGLLFVPGADGTFYALDADSGAKLWQHNNGLGHQGGVISYSVKGRQYIAVVTGWGSPTSGRYCALFGEPFCSMATGAGSLLVFGL